MGSHPVDRQAVWVPPWAWALVLFAVLGIYVLSLDNGLALGGLAHQAHEFFHDGRHFLGVPCH
jgi:hypothetical protein